MQKASLAVVVTITRHELDLETGGVRQSVSSAGKNVRDGVFIEQIFLLVEASELRAPDKGLVVALSRRSVGSHEWNSVTGGRLASLAEDQSSDRNSLNWAIDHAFDTRGGKIFTADDA